MIKRPRTSSLPLLLAASWFWPRAAGAAAALSKDVPAVIDDMFSDFAINASLGVNDECAKGHTAALKSVYSMITGDDREKLARWKILEDRYRLPPADFGQALKQASDSCGALFKAMYDTHGLPGRVCFDSVSPSDWDEATRDDVGRIASVAEASRRLSRIDAMTVVTGPEALRPRVPPEKFAAVDAAVKETAAAFVRLQHRGDVDALRIKYRAKYLDSLGDECRRRATALAKVRTTLTQRVDELRRAAAAVKQERALDQARRMAAAGPTPRPAEGLPSPASGSPTRTYWRDAPVVATLSAQNRAASAAVERAVAAGSLDPAALQAARHVVNLYDGTNPKDPQSWTHDDRARYPRMRGEMETCRRYVQLGEMEEQLVRAVKAKDEKKAGLVEQYIRENLAGYGMFVAAVDPAADRIIATARARASGRTATPAPPVSGIMTNPDARTSRLFPWVVDLRGLARVPPGDRLDLAEQYANDLLRACGQSDPNRVKPAARWILQNAESGDTSLLVGVHGSLSLGGRTVSWGKATPLEGSPGGIALIEKGADRRVVNEYLSDGSRLHWWSGEPTKTGEGRLLANAESVQNIYITREQSSSAGGKVFWYGDNLKATNVARLRTELQGTSAWDKEIKQRFFDPVGRGLKSVFLLGDTVDFFDWAGEVFYDGTVAAGQHSIGRAFDDPFNRMEGLASMVKSYQAYSGKDLLADFDQSLPRDRNNMIVRKASIPSERLNGRGDGPLTMKITGHPKILDFITVLKQRDPAVVQELDTLIPDIRKRLLTQLGYSPQNLKDEFDEIVYGPITDEERAVALLRFVGAGTYGERISQMGEAEKSFWKQAAGGGMGFLEQQGKGLPMLLALYGLGNLAAASDRLAAATGVTDAGNLTRTAAARNGLLRVVNGTVQRVNGTLSKYMDLTWKAGLPSGFVDVLQATQSTDPSVLTRALLTFGNDVTMIAHGYAERSNQRREAIEHLSPVREGLLRALREAPHDDARRAEWEKSLSLVNGQLAQLMPYEQYKATTQPKAAPEPVAARTPVERKTAVREVEAAPAPDDGAPQRKRLAAVVGAGFLDPHESRVYLDSHRNVTAQRIRDYARKSAPDPARRAEVERESWSMLYPDGSKMPDAEPSARRTAKTVPPPNEAPRPPPGELAVEHAAAETLWGDPRFRYWLDIPRDAPQRQVVATKVTELVGRALDKAGVRPEDRAAAVERIKADLYGRLSVPSSATGRTPAAAAEAPRLKTGPIEESFRILKAEERPDAATTAAAVDLYHTDSLTGMRNRAYLEAHLPDLLADLRDPAVAMLDMNNFGAVNAGLAEATDPVTGKSLADGMLAKAGPRIDALAAAAGVTVVRWGGEEIVVLGETARLLEFSAAMRRAFPPEKVMRDAGFDERSPEWKAVEKAMAARQGTFGDFTYGVARLHGRGFDAALESADHALLTAKEAGQRGAVFVEDPETKTAVRWDPAAADERRVAAVAAARPGAPPADLPRRLNALKSRLSPAAYADFIEAAFKDPLTGTKTADWLQVAGPGWEAAYEGRGRIALLSVRGFKQINDSLGHKDGDAFLARFGALMREEIARLRADGLRIEDPVRLGGKDFMLVGLDAEEGAKRLSAFLDRQADAGGLLPMVRMDAARAAATEKAQGPAIPVGTVRLSVAPFEGGLGRSLTRAVLGLEERKAAEAPASVPARPFAAAAPAVRPGTGVRVGAGENGVVYRAESDHGPVAVKLAFFRPDALRSEAEVMTAAYAAFTADGPRASDSVLRLPRLLGYSEIDERSLSPERPERRSPALVMEWIEGPTLKDFVAGGGKVTRAQWDSFKAGIARLHELGFAHNDLFTDNVKVVRDPATGLTRFVLLDFGLAVRAPDAVALDKDARQLEHMRRNCGIDDAPAREPREDERKNDAREEPKSDEEAAPPRAPRAVRDTLLARTKDFERLISARKYQRAAEARDALLADVAATGDSELFDKVEWRVARAAEPLAVGPMKGLVLLAKDFVAPDRQAKMAWDAFDAAAARGRSETAGKPPRGLRETQEFSDCVVRSLWEHPGLRYLRDTAPFKDLPPSRAYAKFLDFAEAASGEPIRKTGLDEAGQRALLARLGLRFEAQGPPASADALVKAIRADDGVVGGVMWSNGIGLQFHQVVIAGAYREAGRWRFLLFDPNLRAPRVLTFEELKLLDLTLDRVTPEDGPRFLSQTTLPGKTEQLDSLRAKAEKALADPARWSAPRAEPFDRSARAGSLLNPAFLDTNILSKARLGDATARAFIDSQPRVRVTGQVVVEAFNVDERSLEASIARKEPGLAPDRLSARTVAAQTEILEKVDGYFNGLISDGRLLVQSVASVPPEEVAGYASAREKADRFLREKGLSAEDASVVAGVIAQSRGQQAVFVTMDRGPGRTLAALKASDSVRREFAKVLPGYSLVEVLMLAPATK